jgi:hypothetical protein
MLNRYGSMTNRHADDSVNVIGIRNGNRTRVYEIHFSSRTLRDGRRFVVRADEKLTAFLELESPISNE